MLKSNMLYIGVAVVVIIIGGLFLSNKNKTAKNETPTPATQSPSAPSESNTSEGQSASGSKVEDAFVELLAQTTYHTQTNNQAGWTAQNENDLFAKYGVTKEEVDAFSKSLRKDPAHAQALVQKYTQRLQELQKNGN